MPSMRKNVPYIPRADGSFRDWLNNFARVVAENPSPLGVSNAKAAALVELARRYQAALERARSPGTKSVKATGTKNAVRKEAWRTVRPMCMGIKANRKIGDAKKIELGIHPPHTKQPRIKRPRGAPSLTLDRITSLVHRLRYHDPQSPSRFAKPHGVIRCEILIALGRRRARGIDSAKRLHVATRHVFKVKHQAKDRGKTATYFARWATERGLAGPWSAPLAVTIA